MAKQTALITGATAGFGKACAKIFAENGFNLIVTGRRNDRLEELKSELTNAFNVQVTPLCFDVRNADETQDAISNIANQEIHVLINNAGLAVGKGSIADGLLDDWNRMIDTNVKGILHVSQAVIPLIPAGGLIINIGSIAGKEVYPGGNVYCATKHAVDALSKGMRIDLLDKGIRVGQICPGAAETEFSIVRFKGDKSVADSVYKGFDPLIAEDIAEAAMFMASRPKHVNINELIIMPAAQASSQNLLKNE